MKRKKNKNKTIKYHSIRRISQRFDFEISEYEYTNIIEAIQKKTKTIPVEFIFAQSKTKSFYKIILDDKIMYVIYNKKYKELNTVISEMMFQERFKECLKN